MLSEISKKPQIALLNLVIFVPINLFLKKPKYLPKNPNIFNILDFVPKNNVKAG